MRNRLNVGVSAMLGLGLALMACSVPARPPDAAPPDGLQSEQPDAKAQDLAVCTGTVCTGADGVPECIADLKTDPRHCGSCGRSCPTAEELHEPHSYPACISGTCLVKCSPPYLGCGAAAGQFCQDIQTSPKHCGGCNQACPTSTPSCVAGVCQ
jgi:hypothetical protein